MMHVQKDKRMKNMTRRANKKEFVDNPVSGLGWVRSRWTELYPGRAQGAGKMACRTAERLKSGKVEFRKAISLVDHAE